jgi:hypothetical protein
MRSIQDTLNGVGPVNYVSHGHDSRNGDDWTNKFKDEASDVVADASTCRVRYHWFTSVDSKVNMDKMVGFALKDVQKISVLSRQKIFDADNPSMGHSSWTAKVEPSTFVLLVQRPGDVENHFVFLNEDVANSVAKALTHAVEMCGGKLTR